MKRDPIQDMSILIVDDSKANTTLLKAILNNEGFTCIDNSVNGENTIKKLEETKVDLILISSVLSHESGITLCSVISSDLRYEDIPILIVTADSKMQTLRKSFENGAIDYISKPINSVELIARVQAHLIRKQIMDERKTSAITDVLTKLYNRRYFDTVFDRQYNKALLEDKYLTFFMIDIDNFKKYNDNYGHQKGDEVLSSVSETMKSQLRRNGDYIFRLGGEEFSILLLDIPDNYCLKLSDAIHSAIYDLNIEHKLNENYGRISISIGVSKVKVNKSISKFDIYNSADSALYEAKKTGRAKSVFTKLG